MWAYASAADPDAGVPAGTDAPLDSVLVRRAQAGSRDAAAALFARHWPQARRAALAVTGSDAAADDVAQDAFERAFAGIARFDASRPFGPWLHRIVVNRAIDLARRDRRLTRLDRAPQEALTAWEADTSGDPAVLEALAGLSPERRAVIVLRHLLDYRPPEIAEILGIPVGTVNSRLGRALDDMRERLGERR